VPKKSVIVMLPTAPPEPMLEQAIRQRAYELYLKRAMAPGHPLMTGYRRKPSLYTATQRQTPTSLDREGVCLCRWSCLGLVPFCGWDSG
jgi:hypothetical protein